jgi:serine/threonine protein kinase
MLKTKIQIDKTNNIIIKRYDKKQLLSSSSFIQKRIDMINTFDYDRYKSIPKTSISLENETYIYRQEYLKAKKHILDISFLYKLAEALDYLQNIGFIHGDLNRKNILYTDDGYKIIDFEPDLYQIKNGLKQTMITIPYLSNNDKKEDKITHLTDKIAFCYFILRISEKFDNKDIVKLSRSFNHQKYLGINEKKINVMNFKELIYLLL